MNIGFANFALRFFDIATTLQESGKQVHVDHLRTKIYHLVKKIVNVVQQIMR